MANCRNIRSLIVSFTSVCWNIYYVDILFLRYSLYPLFLLIRFTFWTFLVKKIYCQMVELYFFFGKTALFNWTKLKLPIILQKKHVTKMGYNPSSRFTALTRGRKQTKWTKMNMKVAFTRESWVNELICIENDRDDGSRRVIRK